MAAAFICIPEPNIINNIIIFGVIHAIDWILMVATALMGILWAYYWNKEHFDKTTGKVVRGNNLFFTLIPPQNFPL